MIKSCVKTFGIDLKLNILYQFILSRDLQLICSQLKRKLSSRAISESFQVSGISQCLWQRAPDFGGQKANGICSMSLPRHDRNFQDIFRISSIAGATAFINQFQEVGRC